MKKILALLCLVFALGSLTACSEAEELAVGEDAASFQEEAINIITDMTSWDEATTEQYKEYFGEDGDQPSKGYIALIKAWEANKADLGAFQEVIETKVIIVEDGYKVEISGQFAEHEGVAAINYTKKGAVTGGSFNPTYTMGEKMTRAGLNTLMGMGTVFIILILISLVISSFKFIGKAQNKKLEQAQKKSEEVVVQPIAEAAVPEDNLAADMELVAVITAAIAAYDENVSADGLVVRSIRRVNTTSKWKRG